jgi:mannosyl-oligosaccharide alpha-1,3-glucosidase
VVVPSELDQIPVLVRGGSILPTRERLRRSSPLMKQDPFTLSIALDKNGTARGELYLDDGEGYAHRQGEIVWRQFAAQITGTVLSITNRDLVSQKLGEAVDGVVFESYDPENAFAKSIDQVRIERVIISGMPSPPFEVRVREGVGLVEWGFTTGVAYSDGKEGNAAVLVLKDPKIRITQDWEIVIPW